LDLTLTASAADEEEVGDRRDLGDVDHNDVLRLLVAGGFDGDVDEGARA